MAEITKAEALKDRVIEGNEDLLERLPGEKEFKLQTVFTFTPEGKTYSGEAIQCSAYGFFKGAEVSHEVTYGLAGLARDKIKERGGVPLQIKLYLGPVQNFRRKFYDRKRDYRAVKVIWTFHGSPFPWLIIPAIAIAVALAVGSVGFLVAIVKSKPEHYTGMIAAAQEAAGAMPVTAKWLAIGAGLVALVSLVGVRRRSTA